VCGYRLDLKIVEWGGGTFCSSGNGFSPCMFFSFHDSVWLTDVV
jgi:hypothetical protein